MERFKGGKGGRHDLVIISKIKGKKIKGIILVNNVSECLQNVLNIPSRKANNSKTKEFMKLLILEN